ncbi:hypothetical protein [Streptantibioticus silvisoli]|uniref:Uncharacterized protein n=1 Tax=Streptantibioticus silvisoli TaxID=2705255 RepID=A0ABT6W5X6_9ACTN|nr:hypothetical protein [Streptantibioticus silvisoli]MDI5965785.1 hypothetical protein [Streptantibioticus silvisoli]
MASTLRYTTMDNREITSRSETLDAAIRGARNAWWAGRDDRFFMILNASGSTVAVVHRAQVTKG